MQRLCLNSQLLWRMATKNKSNLHKITKLIYVILFTVLSYYVFVGSKYERHSIHDKVEDFLTKKFTNHWYSKCPSNRMSSSCKGRYEIIEIDGVKIDANKWTQPTGQIRSKWNKQRKYFVDLTFIHDPAYRRTY